MRLVWDDRRLDDGRRQFTAHIGAKSPALAGWPAESEEPCRHKRRLPNLVFDMDLLCYTNLPMFLVCDDTRVKDGLLFNGASRLRAYVVPCEGPVHLE